MLETLGTISAKAMVNAVEDKTKDSYKYLLISGTDHSW